MLFQWGQLLGWTTPGARCYQSAGCGVCNHIYAAEISSAAIPCQDRTALRLQRKKKAFWPSEVSRITGLQLPGNTCCLDVTYPCTSKCMYTHQHGHMILSIDQLWGPRVSSLVCQWSQPLLLMLSPASSVGQLLLMMSVQVCMCEGLSCVRFFCPHNRLLLPLLGTAVPTMMNKVQLVAVVLLATTSAVLSQEWVDYVAKTKFESIRYDLRQEDWLKAAKPAFFEVCRSYDLG